MEWISVKDKMPEEEGRYFVFAESKDPDKPFIQIAWYEPDGFGWSLVPSVWVKAITHWMPLPTRPLSRSPF